MTDFTFGQVETVLASLNQIAPHKRTAFVSRLKHLQKNGLPVRDRSGRGKSGSYTFNHLMQLVVGLELVQSGLPPQRAATIVTESWVEMLHAIYVGTWTQNEVENFIDFVELEGGKQEDFFKGSSFVWLISPETLRDLTIHADETQDWERWFRTMSIHDIGMFLEDERPHYGDGEVARWRHIIIDGTGLTRQVVKGLVWQLGYASIHELRGDIEQEIEETVEAAQSYSGYIDRLRAIDPDREIGELIRAALDIDPAKLKIALISGAQVRAAELLPFLPLPIRVMMGDIAHRPIEEQHIPESAVGSEWLIRFGLVSVTDGAPTWTPTARAMLQRLAKEPRVPEGYTDSVGSKA